MTSALLAIHDEDPEALTHEEIASILFSLSFAGHETSNCLIGNVARRLLERRERWERVVADPALIPAAVEETLRFDPSVTVWRRVTKQPVTLGGIELPAGAKVFLWLAAAGRDASVFPAPDEFDIERPTPAGTWRSGAASTSAWARAWASSRPRSRSPSSQRASRACGWSRARS